MLQKLFVYTVVHSYSTYVIAVRKISEIFEENNSGGDLFRKVTVMDVLLRIF